MPFTRPSSPRCRGQFLAVLSGGLLTLSFSPNPFSFAAWFALVPLLIGIRKVSSFQAFRLGLLTGLAHYLSLMYWIVVVLEHYGNLHMAAALFSLLLLSLYLSLYPALFAAAAARLNNSPVSPFLLAAYWVALEYLRAHVITGFPWCLLGCSQYARIHLIQSADLFGAYGLSFLIVLVNGLVSRRIAMPLSRRTGTLRWDLPVAAVLIMAAWAYGHYRISEIEAWEGAARPVEAAVIQANIDQSVKWDPAFQEKTIEAYARLTRSARGFHPELIVWPETALPFFFQDDPKKASRIFSLAAESKAALVFGGPAYRRQEGVVCYYNRAYLIGPEARHVSYYDKIHLVPFGEYVPLKRYFPFIRRLVEAAGDFAPGEKLRPLKTGDLSLGVLICFEAIFPELGRGLVQEGANLLVNLTNDAWFGRTSAPFQHLSMAVFRAVENRRPMIRAANTGFSAFVAPTGLIQARSQLFVQTILTGSTPVAAFPLTIYTRFGDFFAVTLLGVAAAHLGWIFCSRRLARSARRFEP